MQELLASLAPACCPAAEAAHLQLAEQARCLAAAWQHGPVLPDCLQAVTQGWQPALLGAARHCELCPVVLAAPFAKRLSQDTIAAFL